MGKKLAVVAGVVVAVLLVAYLAISWFFSGMVVKFETKTLAEDQARRGTPADFGLPEPEEITFDNGDITLAGWLFMNDDEPNCGVILMHGRSGTRYGALKYAPLFWDRGCDLLLFDARYHGESGGDYGSYGFFEKDDVLAATDWLAQRAGLTPAQIGLMGESYGGAAALQAAALRPEIAFVAADSAYRDMASIVEEQAVQLFGPAMKILVPGALAVSGLRAGFAPSQVSPIEAAEAIQVPVFLSHSLTDEYTVSVHSSDIYPRIAHERKALHLTDWGAEHGQSIDTDFGAYKAHMDEFLDAFVPQFEGP